MCDLDSILASYACLSLIYVAGNLIKILRLILFNQ